jgi:hypothetical protein
VLLGYTGAEVVMVVWGLFVLRKCVAVPSG